tara:strand:+ start:9289 stop:11808 length:2520 start_codon:yes stop_codon:yes gene_type:complete
MARVSFAFSNFTAGELSPRLDGRTDINKYFNGTKTMENLVIHPHGSASRRSGTKFVAEVNTSSASTRIIPFEFSTTQTYILELGNQYMRFYKDGGYITEANKTITGATQANPCVITSNSHGYSNGDEVYIASVVGMTELNNKRYLVKNKSTNTFELTDIDGNNINSSSFTAYSSAGTAARIYEIATPYETANIFDVTFAQSADTMYLAHPSYSIRKLTRTGHTSWTLAAPTFTETSSTVISTSNNYPSTVTFFEERLVFAGSNNNPQTIWFSKSGDYENLTVGTDADHAMIYTIASNQVNAIRYMSSQRSLILGTTGGEFIVTASGSSEPLTPTNIQIKKQANYGTSKIQPAQVGNVTLFLQRAKRKVRELTYNYDSDSYVAPDLTILAEHITDSGIKEMSYQQEPHGILWCVRNDGQLCGLTYQRTENVIGWHRHIIGGYADSGKTIIQHAKSFTSNASNVSVGSDTITISSHGYSTGDAVYYYAGSNVIGGLSNEKLYYVIATNSNTIKLATTAANATAGTAIDLYSAPSTNTTQYIYKGVNIYNNILYSASHGFSTGDYIYYNNTGTSIGGLTDKQKYYILKIDNDQFKLSTTNDFSSYVNLLSAHTTAQTDKILVDAKVESIATIPTESNEYQTFIVVQRYINGVTRRFIEFFNNYDFGDDVSDAFYVDSGLTYSGGATTSISGLDHLEGETVAILADGGTHPNKTVSSGSITLDRSSKSVHIGLPYTSILQTMRIEAGAEDGVAQGKTKRIHDVTLRLLDTVGVEVGGSLTDMENIPFRSSSFPLTVSIPLFTGDKDAEFRSDYDKDGFIFLRQADPLPLTIVSVFARLNTFDA